MADEKANTKDLDIEQPSIPHIVEPDGTTTFATSEGYRHATPPRKPAFQSRRLRPSLLLVNDIGLEAKRAGKAPRLEVNEVSTSDSSSDLDEVPSVRRLFHKMKSAKPSIQAAAPSAIELQKIKDLEEEYGWMQRWRLPNTSGDERQCRWIHISSKFPENLQGVLLGLSDWQADHSKLIQHLRQLDKCVYDNERHSKHGKYFSPFFQPLGTEEVQSSNDSDGLPRHVDPVFMSISFLDWTVYPGPTPPLRFQVDERETYFSSRSSAHPLRSLLQHYYRLEDTRDRERTQVFSKHRPWQNDRDLDLKVRRWYGVHPTGLNVDELWVLVIDAKHVVTFSSNQSWKSRWPPLQLVSRIAEVSFRGVRDHLMQSGKQDYTSMTHVLTAIHAASGMMHRSFWADMPLPCTDRYAGYLGHLQYRLHRHATTKLVMDLLQVQDELTIVLKLTRRQAELINNIRLYYRSVGLLGSDQEPNQETMRLTPDSRSMLQKSEDRSSDIDLLPLPRGQRYLEPIPRASVAGLHRNRTFFIPRDPLDELMDNLQREIDDLSELHANSNELVNRTVQLVNIRLEDHGQAILVFTAVTVLFLPLNFVTSFFGMNTSDIRTMGGTQSIFWISACILTIVVIAATGFIAFYGPRLKEALVLRQQQRSTSTSSDSLSSWSSDYLFPWRRKNSGWQPPTDLAARRAAQGFVVLDAGKIPNADYFDSRSRAPKLASFRPRFKY